MHKIGRLRLLSAVAALAILAVLAGVYGIGHLRSNPADAACQPAVNTAERIAPLVHGEVAALALAQTPFRVPDLAFKDAQAATRRSPIGAAAPCFSISGPPGACRAAAKCRRSTRLQAKLGGPDFEVVAVNIDTRDPQKPLAFLKDVGISHLAYYSDRSAHVFEDLKTAGKAFGMPTTLMVDPRRLRDRQHGRPRRMGERGRREACERGDQMAPRPLAATWRAAQNFCAASISFTTEELPLLIHARHLRGRTVGGQG